MRGWLIDINVVSELRRARPAQKVRAFVAAQPGDAVFTSDVMFAEVRFGIEQIAEPARRADLVQWLDRTLRPLFAGRIVAVTEEVLLRWRLLLEAGRKRGHTFSEPDLLVAAMAASADLIVVSRDVSEFIAAGVPVFDPWDWTLHARGRADHIADADTVDALAKAIELISLRKQVHQGM
ncbi:MAG: PIN domain-containing protein [Hyphomicrobiales bacterium]|nr:PIN domain-containing protein [Hyphomicrobiales bacterium]